MKNEAKMPKKHLVKWACQGEDRSYLLCRWMWRKWNPTLVTKKLLLLYHLLQTFILCTLFIFMHTLHSVFGRPFVKRFALCYQTVVCLSCSVCDVGVLWPNGWMDQDKTWHARRPRPWPDCVRWGRSSPPQKGAEPPRQFSAHVYCGQRLDASRCHLIRR